MGVWRDTNLEELVLTGPRLSLRPWRSDDAPAVFEALQNAAMRAYLPLPDPYRRADSEQFVNIAAAEHRRDGTGFDSAVVDGRSGTLIGAASLRLPAGRQPRASIGYWIAPAAQGHGFAAEAADVQARWALERGVERVEIRCAVGNLGSARAALRAGFSFESVQRAAELTAWGLAEAAIFARTATDSGSPVGALRPALEPGSVTDGVVSLRVVEPSDAGTLLAEQTDAESRRWSLRSAPPTAADTAATAARSGLDWLVGSTGRMIIVDVASGRPAGTLDIRAVGPPQVAALGYGVLAAFRGRRYTTRALRLIAAWAFDQAGIERLELGAKTDNIASQRAALAAGFRPEGTAARRLRNPDGSFSDEAQFALLKPEPSRR
jgi:RimJ/RimL family protein N-acetyltransferase